VLQINPMKQFFYLVLFFSAFSSIAQTKVLKFSSDVWPPFTNVEGEKAIAIDIAEKALERVNVQSDYVITDFDAVIEGINTGEFDGSLAFWKSEEREEKLLFSDPYLENQLILVGRKGTNVSLTSLSELSHSKIGLVAGYAYEDHLKDISDLQIVYGKNDQDNLENLLSEKVDFMLVDALLMQYLLKYEINDVSAMLEFAKEPLIVKPLHLALRKDTPNAEKIISLFNEEIKKMVLEGSYNELLGLNWVRDDIDGDGTLEIILIGTEAGIDAPENAYSIRTSSNSNSNKFYIENQYYNSWEDVPQKYKVPKTEYAASDSHQGIGMTLKF